MKSDKWADNYIDYKLNRYFDTTENAIDLPHVQDQDDKITSLQWSASASPRQIKAIKEQKQLRLTNYQHETIYQEKLYAFEARKAVFMANRIKAVEAYKKWAEKKGVNEQKIKMMTKQIWDSLT